MVLSIKEVKAITQLIRYREAKHQLRTDGKTVHYDKRVNLRVAPCSPGYFPAVRHGLLHFLALLVDELSASRLTYLGLRVPEGSVTLERGNRPENKIQVHG